MHRFAHRSAFILLTAAVVAACSDSAPVAPEAVDPASESYSKGKGSPPGKGGGGGGDDSGGVLIDASLAFETSGRSAANLYLANADGSGSSELLSIKFGLSLSYTFDPINDAIVYSHASELERLEYSITNGVLSVDNATPLGACSHPSYSPNGEEIACRGRDADGNLEIRTIAPDGTVLQMLYTAAEQHYIRAIEWDHTGDAVYFVEEDASDHGSILKVDLGGDEPTATEVFFDPDLDVHAFAVAKTASGLVAFSTLDDAIYQLHPVSGLSLLTSGTEPAYSADDSEIYFTAAGGKEIRKISSTGGASAPVVKGVSPELRR